MRVLSVDWDYFFPDAFPFDWGHREESLYFEAIWSMRVADRDRTGKSVLDIMIPDKEVLRGFWKKVCLNNPIMLYISESHADLGFILKDLQTEELYNFDAHHDFCYGETIPSDPDCGSWAGYLLKKNRLKKYHVIYPEWRKDSPENKPKIMDQFSSKINIHHEIPKMPSIDLVFICRSYAWTPPWADDAWKRFINFWKNDSFLWENKIIAPSVLKSRHPSIKEATVLREKMLADFQRLRAVGGAK